MGRADSEPAASILGIIIILFLYRGVRGAAVAFEYEQKSAANKDKHGVDFEEAQELWHDPDVIEIPARTTDEPRWLVIGKMEAKHWSAVITRRGGNIRLISVRRSRSEEVEAYESESDEI
jgi:uncharacterized protein